MKELITTLYGKEIEEFKGFTFMQKVACIYLIASFMLLMLVACSNSLVAMAVAAVNMVAAILTGKNHIPDFDKEDE